MRTFSTALAVAGLVGLTMVSIAIVGDVLLRFFFASPITGMWDVVGLASAVSITAFFPLSLVTRSHLSLKPFASFASPIVVRALDFFGAAITTIFFAVVAWQVFRYAYSSHNFNEVTPILRLRIAEFWFAAGALFAATTVVAAYVLLRPRRAGSPQESEGNDAE